MSTRCHIVVIDNGEEKGYIYHHCDGYPDGVGEELKEILSKCNEYNDYETIMEKILDYDDSYEEDTGIHGDEEYIYKIYVIGETATLRCFESYGANLGDIIFSIQYPENTDREKLLTKYSKLTYNTTEEKEAFLDGAEWMEKCPSESLIRKILSTAMKTIPDFSGDLNAWARDINKMLNNSDGEGTISNSNVV